MNINRLFKQSAIVETQIGSDAYGDQYASPVTVPCFISDESRLVRAKSAEEVISTTTLYAPVSAAAEVTPVAGQFAAGSKVTVNGRSCTVINTAVHDAAGPIRVHHISVHLT